MSPGRPAHTCRDAVISVVGCEVDDYDSLPSAQLAFPIAGGTITGRRVHPASSNCVRPLRPEKPSTAAADGCCRSKDTVHCFFHVASSEIMPARRWPPKDTAHRARFEKPPSLTVGGSPGRHDGEAGRARSSRASQPAIPDRAKWCRVNADTAARRNQGSTIARDGSVRPSVGDQLPDVSLPTGHEPKTRPDSSHSR